MVEVRTSVHVWTKVSLECLRSKKAISVINHLLEHKHKVWETLSHLSKRSHNIFLFLATFSHVFVNVLFFLLGRNGNGHTCACIHTWDHLKCIHIYIYLCGKEYYAQRHGNKTQTEFNLFSIFLLSVFNFPLAISLSLLREREIKPFP